MSEKGRPSTYSAEVAAEICRRLSEGQTLREVCRDEAMPSESTVRGWALDDREGFSAQYARSREIGYFSMADEMMEVADDGRNDWMQRTDDNGGTSWQVNGEHIQRSRLRVDTRKWMLSKALPKVFGDKVTQAVVGGDDDDKPVSIIHKIERVVVRPPDRDG